MSKKKERLAHIVELSKNLTCGYCANSFQGSYSQARKVRYEKATVYCCKDCRLRSARERLQKRVSIICQECSEKFEVIPSRSHQMFCSQECYQKSSFAQKHRASNLEKATEVNIANNEKFKEENSTTCEACGDLFYRIPSKNARFCSTECASVFRSSEFMLSDDAVSKIKFIKPDSYTKFRQQAEMPCIVEGCSWVGHGLSYHLARTHRISARQAKLFGGFNVSEGLISQDLKEVLSQRDHQGIAIDKKYRGRKLREELGRKYPISDEWRESQRLAAKKREEEKHV